MPKDPRKRNTAHHATAYQSIPLEWASEKQKEIFEYGPAPACASGGFGSAKTFAFCAKALYLSDIFPGNRGIIARRVWEDLKKTTMSTFFKLCPAQAYNQGGRRSDSEKILRLNNGSEILWAHLDDPETENFVRGVEINWFLLDQAEEIEEELFDMLMGRLGRWDQTLVPQQVMDQYGGLDAWPWKSPQGKPIPPTFPMLTCNPESELHWIYRRFHPDSPEHWEKTHQVSDGSLMSYHDLGYRMWLMSSRENKFLPKQNLDQMLQKDASFVRRFVDGEWGIPEGQIHHVDPLSIVEGTPELVEYLRQTCSLHRSMDHGDAAPTSVAWWAVDQAGNVFCFREYYQPNKLISEHRREVAALSQGERYQFQLADPSIFRKSGQKNGQFWSVSDEWEDCKGLPRETAVWWQPGDNNELGTRNRISEYLRVDPERVHPITKQKGSPRLFFVKRSDSYPQGCYHILRELRSQRRKKLGSEGGRPIFGDERDDKVSDHGYDCVRYFIASRPPVAAGQVAAAVSGKTFMGVRNSYLKFKRGGGYKRMARQMSRRAKYASAV